MKNEWVNKNHGHQWHWGVYGSINWWNENWREFSVIQTQIGDLIGFVDLNDVDLNCNTLQETNTIGSIVLVFCCSKVKLALPNLVW